MMNPGGIAHTKRGENHKRLKKYNMSHHRCVCVWTVEVAISLHKFPTPFSFEPLITVKTSIE